MTDHDQSVFHDGLYQKAILEIGTLRDKLPQDSFASLAREVIRRLSDHPSGSTCSVVFPSDAKIEELTEALMEPDPSAGTAFVERIRAQGASVETVYLAYLAEAAKTLGQWWEEDKITFPDVTIATGHIYAIMRGLRPMFRSDNDYLAQPCAVFTAVCGENHLLGVSMAADLFRKAGWDITLKRGLEHDEIVQYVAASRIPLIGLSAAGEHALVPLAKIVVALRISMPHTAIMVSGAILNTCYDSVREMGVDITPTSMDDALAQARAIWDQSTRQSQVG
jgi:methanogenic corrinoid protein MtbC1